MRNRLRESTRPRAQDGASAVEYGLLVAAIAGLIAVIAFSLGGVVLNGLFEDTCQDIKDGGSLAATCS